MQILCTLCVWGWKSSHSCTIRRKASHSPAKKIKFIWEDAQSLEPFNRLTADHAKETVSIFRKYSICHIKGFLALPGEDPIPTLPAPFQEWDDLVSKIPILLKEPPEEGFRRKVKRLDILDHTLLQTKAELRRGYLVLSALANAYLFGLKKQSPRYYSKTNLCSTLWYR